jgi:hypothetical protein
VVGFQAREGKGRRSAALDDWFFVVSRMCFLIRGAGRRGGSVCVRVCVCYNHYLTNKREGGAQPWYGADCHLAGEFEQGGLICFSVPSK